MKLDQPIDQEKFQAALARERANLGLAVTFGTSSTLVGTSGNSSVRRPKGKKATDHQVEGDPNWQEGEHPRGPGGLFIQKGSSGPAVSAAQEILGINSDGEYGKRTVKAVRRYQRQNGLMVDGVIGQQTAAALLGNDGADEIEPGALRPGQRKRLRKRAKK